MKEFFCKRTLDFFAEQLILIVAARNDPLPDKRRRIL
jgi:hypothetical protein